MKKIKLIFTCLLFTLSGYSQGLEMDSVAGGGYVQKTSGVNWMNYLLAPQGARQEFVLKTSLSEKPICYGYLYVSADRMNGAVCYIPKNIWQDKDVQEIYLDNDANWIRLSLVPKAHPEYLGYQYDRLFIETNSNGSEVLGFWYLDKITTPDFVTYHGNWTNGLPIGEGNKTYYIQFL
ncbi:hypothetical protein EBU94_02795 [bacterium]|jgi:hypothetical protein|nr:hypothetical protein [bacterium]